MQKEEKNERPKKEIGKYYKIISEMKIQSAQGQRDKIESTLKDIVDENEKPNQTKI